ncbi:MAG: metal-dependent hydrolase [Nanoarchaeota archaeon]
MDILFHYIAGIMISKLVTGEYLFIAGIIAMLPDLIVTIFCETEKIRLSSKKSLKLFILDFKKYSKRIKFVGSFDKLMYRITHSLFTWVLFSLVMFLFFKNLFIVLSLAYLSHILVDIFTHERDFATRIFYPLSEFHIKAKSWGLHKEVFIIAWSFLLIVFFLISKI